MLIADEVLIPRSSGNHLATGRLNGAGYSSREGCKKRLERWYAKGKKRAADFGVLNGEEWIVSPRWIRQPIATDHKVEPHTRNGNDSVVRQGESAMKNDEQVKTVRETHKTPGNNTSESLIFFMLVRLTLLIIAAGMTKITKSQTRDKAELVT